MPSEEGGNLVIAAHKAGRASGTPEPRGIQGTCNPARHRTPATQHQGFAVEERLPLPRRLPPASIGQPAPASPADPQLLQMDPLRAHRPVCASPSWGL